MSARLDNPSEGMFIKAFGLQMMVSRIEWGEKFAAAMSPSYGLSCTVDFRHSMEHGDELEFSL